MKLYAEINKSEQQDDGTIKVWGYASTEAVDSDGETITAAAMKAALPDYMKFGAVREMHGKSAAGTAIEARVEDDGRTLFGAHIVDPVAVKKVQAGVYKGFSVGGKATQRDELNKSIITGLSLIEVSLVDRPANPEAVFTCYKADAADKDDEEEKPAADEGEGDDADESGKEADKEGGKEDAEKAAAVVAKAEDSTDLRKALDVSQADLRKALADRDAALAKVEAQAERIAALEAQPEPPKAVLKPAAIEKMADTGGADPMGQFAGIPNTDGTLNEAATLIKAAHAGLLK